MSPSTPADPTWHDPTHYPTRALEPSERITPVVLHGRHRIQLDAPSGTLPRRRQNTPAEIYAAHARSELPTWAAELARGTVLALERRLARFRWHGGDERFRFSLYHRLDERTLIGHGEGDAVPVLTIDPGHPRITPAHREHKLLAFLDDVEHGPSDPGDKIYAFGLESVDRLPEAVRRHEPRLVIEECWRLVSAFEDWVVGGPAGAVTLTPGESRSFEVSSTRTSTRTSKAGVTIIEKDSREGTEEFRDAFTRKMQRNFSQQSEVSWSASESLDGDGITASGERTAEFATSLSTLLETTRETVRELVQKHKEERGLTLTREDELSEEVESSEEASRTLVHKGPQPVTYLYYQLDAAHRVLIELVGLRLVYTGARRSDGEQVLDLGGAWEVGVAALASKGAETLVAAVDELVRARYAELGCLETAADHVRLLPTPADDESMRIDRRTPLMAADRRQTGPLPLTRSSETVDVRTPYLHVEARRPRYGVVTPES